MKPHIRYPYLFIIFMCMEILSSIHIYAQTPQNLKEVTVVASRTTNTAEGYITNLRGSDIAKGKPVVDVLGFLPNISKENNTIKINGLPVSKIFIDGVKISGIKELGNIPGENIDRIQVKYLAGADQKSSLSGGVIMITLRRPPQGGYYGNISLDADMHRSYGFGQANIGGMVNYRINNLSIYDNLNLGFQRTREESGEWLYGPTLNSVLEEVSKSHGFNIRNRLSVTRQLKSGAQIGGSYYIASNMPRISSSTDNDGGFSSIHSTINTLVQEGTLKFSKELGKRGVSLEVTADYYNRHSNKDTDYDDESHSPFSQNNKNSLNLWKLKADILYPFSKGLVWKFGISSQWINSKFTPGSLTENDRFILSDVPARTTGFTPLVYASAQGIVWKLKYSAGINWQLNRIGYTDCKENVTSHNTQWAFNPTLQIMMPFGAKRNHAVMLNYKHTLNDIPYAAISSVVNWSDAYNYTVGNPHLKALSADMIMAALALFRNKLNITALYAHTHNRIYWQTFQDTSNPDVFFSKPINISGENVWGIGAEWIQKPIKWWQFKLSGRVEITPENNIIDGIHYDRTRIKEYFSLNNNFSFTNNWGGMLNANVEPTYTSLDRTYHTVYDISGRIFKSFLKRKLQLAVDFTAAGNRRKITRQVGENRITRKFTTPVQYIGFSLTWKFSGGKKVNVDVVEGIQEYQEIKDH